MTSMKERAFELVEDVFRGVVDKGGNFYINHLIKVASKVKGDKDKTIALLHDIIEDTDLTKEDLVSMGFGEDIVESVVVLSRKNGETYSNFIKRIIDSKNISAIRVKLADLEDNMDLSRITKPTDKDKERIEKRYKPAYTALTESLMEYEKNI